MTQDQHLLQQMVHNGAEALAALAASVAASDDVTVLGTAALLNPAPVLLLAQAASAATTTRQRQLVAIAAAHVDGDVNLVDALARDRLARSPRQRPRRLDQCPQPSHRPDTQGPVMTTFAAPTPSTGAQAGPRPPGVRRRPDPRWLLTALAFPPAGYVGHLIGGPVDSPSAAAVGGLITGALVGAAQWALLRRRGIAWAWVVATALGLAGGLAAGAALVSYETGPAALVIMGAVSGLGVGMAQARQLTGTGRRIGWSLLTAAVWALGWAVSTSIGIAVEEQFVAFGISGALASAAVQSSVIGSLVTTQATS